MVFQQLQFSNVSQGINGLLIGGVLMPDWLLWKPSLNGLLMAGLLNARLVIVETFNKWFVDWWCANARLVIVETFNKWFVDGWFGNARLIIVETFNKWFVDWWCANAILVIAETFNKCSWTGKSVYIPILWDTMFRPMRISHHFRGTYYLHLQDSFQAFDCSPALILGSSEF
jgi:hypothetical protein